MVPIVLLAMTFVASGPALAAEDGKALFEQNCAKCHGPDGKADTPAGKMMKVPALAAEHLVPAKVVETIRTNPKHQMVSKGLSDEQLQGIASYVSTLGGS
jgi:mono/diheme cytochrome c family protein